MSPMDPIKPSSGQGEEGQDAEQPMDPDANGEDDEVLNEDDLLEVIDIDNDVQNEDMAAADMEDLALDEDGEEAGMDGADAESQPDHSSLNYTQHKGSVFCMALHPTNPKLVASGGEDDRAFLWNASSGDTLLECQGHKDSVTCVAFSHDGGYLATGDMSGIVAVWQTSTNTQVWSFEVGDLEWLEWHTAAPVLLAGTNDGSVWMWKIPSGDCKTMQSFGTPCTIGKMMPDGKHACTGYEDGSVRMWDLKTAAAVNTFTGNLAHSGSVTAMDCYHNNNLVITGATDVTAKLLNAPHNKVVATLSHESDSQQDNSVEAVGFSKSQPYAATGTLQGALSIWDIPTQMCRHQCKHEAGIVRLLWDPHAPLIYTGTLDGAVNLWDSRSGHREAQWLSGDGSSILDMALARDSSILVTGTEDGGAKVFSLHNPDR